ncbi:hypothetical protein MNV49_007382 [Pseudohyphozyma bogoriensis]|nr:hypothetical protein MNV49_007382 [Pseudohyphozyma bogoriensis]
MKVFVTGASGWVGTAVCKDLVAHGHTVVGLARSDASAKALADAGYEVHRGSLDDLDSIIASSKAADGVIHCAYKHDFSSPEAIANSTKTEFAVLDAIGSALEGTTKPLVISSGCGGLPLVDGQPADEDGVLPPYVPRSAPEAHALALADQGIHVSAIRLPFTVHGVGEQGFVKMLIDAAKKSGSVPYVGEGLNRWPAIHVSDAAPVYRLAMEKAKARGIYHAVQDVGVETRQVATTIGEQLNLPTKSLSKEEAGAFGFLGMVLALDSPVSSVRTREELGWKPVGPTLLEDLRNGEYYKWFELLNTCAVMKVFVTGASGWIGTEVCKDLAAHGHTVIGLARSDESAEKLSQAGYQVHRGSLDDPDSLIAASRAADAVVHCASKHDFVNPENNLKAEFAAIDAFAKALEGTDKSLIVSSGCGGLPLVDGGPANEDGVLPPHIPRSAPEKYTLALADKGIHVSLIRLPPSVHGLGERGFVKMLIDASRTAGYAPCMGGGTNRWPAVHVSDTAAVYRIAMEKSKIGAIYHAVQDFAVDTREIAERVGRHLGIPVRSLGPEEGKELGFLTMVLNLDTPVSSARTQEELGWKPVGPTLLEDLENPEYYK